MACIFAGLFSTGGYLPFGLWWLTPLSLIVLFYFWSTHKPISCAYLGLAFGMPFYASAMHWIFVLAHDFNNTSISFAALMLAILSLIYSSFIALIGYFQARFFRASFFFIPSSWVLAEWFRGTGLPWLDLGYSQTTQLLSNYAPIGGVRLITFVLLLICILIIKLNNRDSRPFINSEFKKAFALLILILIVPFIISSIPNKSAFDQPDLSVAIVQLNLPINEKWNQENLKPVIEQYRTISQNLSVDLVVWPETAIPTTYRQIKKEYWFSSRPVDGELISGTKEHINGNTFNSAVITCNDEQYLYKKTKLVPFGEYIPNATINKPLFGFLGYTLKELTVGPGDQNIHCKGKSKISLSICYEVAFPDFIKDNAQNSELLVNISEDGWFSNHLGNYQRLQMAQMRAQELQKPMISSSNTGPSALIDKNGRIIEIAHDNKSAVLKADITPNTQTTLFSIFGSWIHFVSIFFIFILTLHRFYRYKKT